MKADTQYNDYLGTSAADISDHQNFKTFLQAKGIDTERFEPIGSSFFSSYDDYFFVHFICVDREKSTKDDPHIVQIAFEQAITREVYFNLFKRYHVIAVQNYFANREIKESIMIDDREVEGANE